MKKRIGNSSIKISMKAAAAIMSCALVFGGCTPSGNLASKEKEQAAAALTETPAPTNTPTPTPEPTATNTPTPIPEPTEEPEITERKDTGSFFANLFSFLTPGEKEAGSTEASTPEPTATNTPTPEPTATNTPTPVPVPTNTPRPVSSEGSDIIGFFGGMFSFLGR